MRVKASFTAISNEWTLTQQVSLYPPLIIRPIYSNHHWQNTESRQFVDWLFQVRFNFVFNHQCKFNDPFQFNLQYSRNHCKSRHRTSLTALIHRETYDRVNFLLLIAGIFALNTLFVLRLKQPVSYYTFKTFDYNVQRTHELLPIVNFIMPITRRKFHLDIISSFDGRILCRMFRRYAS